MPQTARLGVDLGGTKIEAVVLAADGTPRWTRRVATPAGDYTATIATIAALVEAAEAETGLELTVGVGMPGSLSPATGLVRNANSVCLNGRPLGDDLTARLGRPVRLENDANCFALSEASDGAGAGAELVFGVILGTGVGGGLVAHGRLLTGANRVAGEWGHNPLPWPDERERLPPCYCGKRGCLETFLSGPGMRRDHIAHGGAPLEPPEIAAAAAAGEPTCAGTLERYLDRLARGLATVINVVDPEVIVLGGGLSNIAALGRVSERLPLYVFSDTVATRVVQNRHGDASGVRGAAWLWPERGA